jgi:hypothetical protein
MRKHLIALLGLALALPAWSQTTAADTAPQQAGSPVAPGEPATAVERVLVTGNRPGPGLWKISKDDHVLWIFGTYSPLPVKMEWRSRDVEGILSRSQQYLMPPMASAGVGYLAGVAALPFMFGYKDIPDGKTLKDVLPADVYARWLPLKEKYFGSDAGIERQRPVFVADQLYRRALKAAGLANGYEVTGKIAAIARKNAIPMTAHLVTVEIKDPGKRLREFKNSPLDDTACFSKTVGQLETDIDAMRVRANAWAIGDIAAISNFDYAQRQVACDAAILGSRVTDSQPELQTMSARARDAWMASAEKSLAANASTFAVLEMKDIIDPKGLVARLQAKGYVVEAPK